MKLTILKSTITKYDRGNPHRIPQHSLRYPFRSLCRKLRQQTTLAAVGTLLCAASTVCAQSRAVTAPSTNSATFRWAGTSNRIYVEGGGSATLNDIKAALPNVPLDLVDPVKKIWLLRANLVIAEGTKLVLHGTSIGGDINEFRLQSANSSAAESFVIVMADWGFLDIKSTKITSWDPAANGPDTEYQALGRASVRVRSRLAPDGITPLESRMDIVDSEVSYLGYDAAESYGLTWKVLGAHPDPAKSIFDYVNVYGDVINSHLHDNLFGIYTFGAYGSQWLNNEVDHNAGYGIDPHDDSDHLLIEGNNVHHNGIGNLHNASGTPRGLHGIIASRRCDNVVIRNNHSWANAGNGIMLHRHCDNSVIENNETYRNADSGIAIFDTDRTVIRNNLILSNSHAGIRFSVGASDNTAEHNEIGFSGTNGIYFFAGTDLPEPDDNDPVVSARPRRNTVKSNFIHDCGAEGLKWTGADDTEILDNKFQANRAGMRFEEGKGNFLDSNLVPADLVLRSVGSPASPASTYVKNQPFTRVNLGSYSSVSFVDDDGAIFDALEADTTTTVGSAGSTMTLPASSINTLFTVVTRDFQVASAATVRINPTVWNLNGDRSKEWTTQTATASVSVRYAIGDLAPGTRYAITKGKKHAALTATSDSSGHLTFTDTPGTSGPVQYVVRPASGRH
jgi:parallel beta-helix repeat protein